MSVRSLRVFAKKTYLRAPSKFAARLHRRLSRLSPTTSLASRPKPIRGTKRGRASARPTAGALVASSPLTLGPMAAGATHGAAWTAGPRRRRDGLVEANPLKRNRWRRIHAPGGWRWRQRPGSSLLTNPGARAEGRRAQGRARAPRMPRRPDAQR